MAMWAREVRRGRGRACTGAPKGATVAAVLRGGTPWAAFLDVRARGGAAVTWGRRSLISGVHRAALLAGAPGMRGPLVSDRRS